jgi:hypothetical protein
MPVQRYNAIPHPAKLHPNTKARSAPMPEIDFVNNKSGKAYKRLKVAAFPKYVTFQGP